MILFGSVMLDILKLKNYKIGFNFNKMHHINTTDDSVLQTLNQNYILNDVCQFEDKNRLTIFSQVICFLIYIRLF